MELKDKGKFEDGAKLYKEVVRLKETFAPDDSFKLGTVYFNYGTFLYRIWKFDEAVTYLDKALEMADPNNHYDLSYWLVTKGRLLVDLNDLDAVLNYYEQAEKQLNKIENVNISKLNMLYFNKALLYNYLGKYSEALLYFDYIKPLPNQSEFERYEYNNEKFSIYVNAHENQKAGKLYTQLSKSKIPNELKMNFLYDYSKFLYINQKKTIEAIPIYETILDSLQRYPLTKDKILSVYNNLGNCYETNGRYVKALETYQKALVQIYPGFTYTTFKSNPKPVTLYEEAKNILLFRNKAEVLYKYSKSVGDTAYMSSSMELCLRSINTMQKMRLRVSTKQSQFLISKKDRSTFTLTQYIALEMYNQTKNINYLNLAFEVNEKGRAFTLLASMRSQKAMDFGDVPEKVRKKESELNRQLSLYDELIYKEEQAEEPDKNLLSGWEDQLFKANEDYSKLLKKLEREYPEYYRLKYDEEVTDLFGVQKRIAANTTLLEYSYLDSVLIIYTASRDKIGAKKVTLKPGFEDKCIEFLNLITTQNFSDSAGYTYNRFTSLSHELYGILIEPVLSQIDGENLIIIPDAAISYIPFDALLTVEVPPGEPDYRHIPYLLRDYSVGYSYSTTIHFNPLQHVRIPRQAVLAFAPIYAGLVEINPNKPTTRQQKYLDLPMLVGVTDEVNNISKIQKTDAYYNFSAKESVFKEMAGRYKILHLAMHTVVDNNDPMLSKLVFTQTPDGEEDGMLNTYEIYNMKLNSSLTVLSSCSSGYGKIQPGEGVQSLARGFAYAGCPSILMTLWEVGDLSTVTMMTDFYKYLNKHLTKPQALRESKLNFLNSSDELQSNPYFWASYVVIGDSSPLFPFRKDLAAISAFMLILPLGFLRISYKKYKNVGKKRKRQK